jgi:hypothetical protein
MKSDTWESGKKAQVLYGCKFWGFHLHIKILGGFVIFLDIKFFLGVIFSNYSQHIVTVGAASI